MPDPVNGKMPYPDKSNIQGLIMRGYTHPCSVHMLFNFTNALYVPGFFKALVPYLQSAEDWGPVKPEIMLNIGLTWKGISVVRPKLSRSEFSPDFVAGPQTPLNSDPTSNPQASLNDTGPSVPGNWWNQKFKTTDIHCVIHAYALNYEAQDRIVQIITAAAAKSKGFIRELLPLNTGSGRLEQYPFLPQDYIHFNYKDSIDEPSLDPNPKEPNSADLSNFLIGYNPAAGSGSSDSNFANNGCYNAFRILYQDVQAFEDFLEQQACIIAPQMGKPAVYAKEWLAAKLGGRWRNGSPLVLSPVMPDTKTVEEEFTYKDDANGLKCPFSAHTRVANPRDQKVTGGVVPHLLRRGVPYGPAFDKNSADEDRGLIGMFLCGDLAGQFQKIYNWINFNNFSPSAVFPFPQNTQDAMVANRTAQGTNVIDTSFTIPAGEGRQPIKILELPQFVVTRGTAYFLLPSIARIKEIAGV